MRSHVEKTETVRLFHTVRAALFMAVALGAWPGIARAGSLEMIVTETGGPALPIPDNGALDTDPAVGVINVDTTLFNQLLVNYQFTSLATNSNSPGSTASGFLSQSGGVQLLPGG